MKKVKESKAVRFYFELGIDYVFPENPKTHAYSDDEWITARCESLGVDIQKKLSSNFDEIQFSRFNKIIPNANIFTIYFTISKCHDFISNEICSPKKSYTELRIKKYPLSKARESIEKDIRSLLFDDYFIASLLLKYIASRDFVYEIYLGGFVTVERIFTPDEIRDVGGMSFALDIFVEKMISALEYCGMHGDIRQPIVRRNRNNIYVFEVGATCHYGFSEREVVGEMALLEHDMSIEEVQMIGIDNQGDALATRTADSKSIYGSMLEDNLPAGVNLLNFEFDFIDQDDDVYDLDYELLINHGDTILNC